MTAHSCLTVSYIILFFPLWAWNVLMGSQVLVKAEAGFFIWAHTCLYCLLLTEGPLFSEITSDPYKNTGPTDTTNRMYDDKDSNQTNLYLS